MDGSIVHGDDDAQPVDQASPEVEESGQSAPGTPAQTLGVSAQTREGSVSQESTQVPVSLPDGIFSRAMGSPADFLGVVQMLQTVMTGSGGNLLEEQAQGRSGFQESFSSALSAECTPQARDPSESGAQPQGTPDFPHRVQEEHMSPFQQPVSPTTPLPDLPRGASGGHQAPLFGPEHLAQWARLEREAPQLYGPATGQEYFHTAPRSEAPSLSSGEIQAEVRRQLDSLRLSHAVQVEALMRENEALRRQVAVETPGSQEPRRWGSAAAKVLGWFRGGNTNGSLFVPPGPNHILSSLQNLIPDCQEANHLGATSAFVPAQEVPPL